MSSTDVRNRRITDNQQIKVPFSITPEGGVAAVYTTSAMIRQTLVTVLCTHLRERVMNPTFGSRVADLVWQPMGQDTQADLVLEVQQAIDRSDLATLVSVVNVTPIPSSEFQEGAMGVAIEYTSVADAMPTQVTLPSTVFTETR